MNRENTRQVSFEKSPILSVDINHQVTQVTAPQGKRYSKKQIEKSLILLIICY